MYRKVGYAVGAVAGTFAVAYAYECHCLKVGREDFQVLKAVKAKDLQEKTENNEGGFFPVSSVVRTTVSGKRNLSINDAILKARELACRVKDEVGAPGIVIGVSINGKTVWKEGIGLADVENRVPCHPDTVMRIASISKSMTMAVVAKLWQDGKLDLDKAVQSYVPLFPAKTVNKEQVTVTTRQLVSHIAGIRHYEKPSNNSSSNTKEITSKEIRDKINKVEANSAAARKSDSSQKELYIKERFESVQEALKVFQDDDLVFKPGTSFLYSTHGWTLVSAVVEAAAGEPFTVVMKKFFQVMGLKYTCLDESEPLIYNRSRYYRKSKTGHLKNVPYVDNSWKWAGGGFLSTVGDLLHFGNAMMYSYQWRNELGNSYLPGYLQSETVQAMWTPQPRTATMTWGRESGYGMGWVVVPSLQEYGGGDAQKFAVGHDGGAVGASSVLLLVPTCVPHPSATTVPSSFHIPISRNSLTVMSQTTDICIPCGIAVAIISNLQGVSFRRLAMDIAALFCETQ